MFFGEAQLVAQLNHPNIAQIIEFGENEGISFLAMEYVDGPSLRALASAVSRSGDRFPLALAIRIVASACEALAYAHDLTDAATGLPLQLVHRDISPDNILITKSGAVKLVDFGIAKAVTQAHHTKTGLVKGKLPYMSPEQLRADPLDKRSDVFALGVVLYELLAGARPYQAKNDVTLIHAMLFEEGAPLQSKRPDCPLALVKIVDRAREKDCERRYPDCQTMYADLEQLLVSLGEPASHFQIAELVKRYAAAEPKAQATPPRPYEPQVQTDTVKPVAPAPSMATAELPAPAKNGCGRQANRGRHYSGSGSRTATFAPEVGRGRAGGGGARGRRQRHRVVGAGATASARAGDSTGGCRASTRWPQRERGEPQDGARAA